MITSHEIHAILACIRYKDWTFHLGDKNGCLFLQVQFLAPDGGQVKFQHGRKLLLSEHMTPSELLQTALKAVLTAEEHEAREQFTYDGRHIFSPHLNLDAIYTLCGQSQAYSVRAS